MAREMTRSTGGRSMRPGWAPAVSRVVMLVGILALQLGPAAGTTRASSYNNTNPAATVCGNGAHPVKTWTTSYIYSGSTRLALVELRRSDYCNTVWTRITNLTSAAVSVAETVETFSFPDPSDRVGLTSSYDSLQRHGTFPYQAWSNQLDYPNASPPSARATGSIYWLGSWRAAYAGTTAAGNGIMPSWTQEASNFDNGTPLSCNGTTAGACTSWGETGGSWVTIYARIGSGLTALEASDTTGVVIPAWNPASPNNPLILICSSCSEQVLVEGLQLPPAIYAQTPGNVMYVNPSETVAVFTHQWVEVNTTKSLTHTCGSQGSTSSCSKSSVCTTNSCDDRAVISHEFGHVQGLGHCPIDLSVMCNQTTLYWTPQATDVDGLRHIYS